jgi:hypothetical protein
LADAYFVFSSFFGSGAGVFGSAGVAAGAAGIFAAYGSTDFNVK